jgi:hypothetical protein
MPLDDDANAVARCGAFARDMWRWCCAFGVVFIYKFFLYFGILAFYLDLFSDIKTLADLQESRISLVTLWVMVGAYIYRAIGML